MWQISVFQHHCSVRNKRDDVEVGQFVAPYVFVSDYSDAGKFDVTSSEVPSPSLLTTDHLEAQKNH